MSDYNSYEREQEMRELREMRNGESEHDFSVMIVIIFVVCAAVLAGAGWLDNQFGWGLVEWIKGTVMSGGGDGGSS